MRPLAASFALALLSLVSMRSSVAVEANVEQAKFFENRVRPVLEKHCLECHSSTKKIKGSLALDSKTGWTEGGDSGPAVVPGNPEESLLIEAVSWSNLSLQMPPKNKLSESDRAALVEWVRQGAFDPREKRNVDNTADNTDKKSSSKSAMSLEDARQFWSYAPLKDVVVPIVQNTAWPRNDIDRFVLGNLEARKIEPAQDADPMVLVRRLSYVLTGMPPSPEQLSRLRGVSESELERDISNLVDELLETTAFAERFASHWLSITRFAESSGGGRTLLFKDAWRFRDYVVQSIAENKPVNQLIREHIAGDLLPASDHHQRASQLIASGFLAFGPTIYEEQDKQRLRFDIIDEQIDTIGKAFLGQTISCARCHDHKFDPISQSDYYALAGIFSSTRTLFNYTDNVARWIDTDLPLDDAEEQRFADAESQIAELEKQIKTKKNQLAKFKDVDSGLAYKTDQPIPLSDLAGVVLDDEDAKANGEWKHSKHSPHYFGKGYVHDDAKNKGAKTLTFTPDILSSGRYEVRFAYPSTGGRATRVPIHIFHAMGDSTVYIDQTKPPDIEGRFVSLGTYSFEKGRESYVIVSNEETSGFVVADAMQFLMEDGQEPKKPVSSDSNVAQELRKEIQTAEAALSKAKKVKGLRPIAMSVRDESEIRDTEIRIRGDVHQRAALVPRGFLSVLAPKPITLPPTLPPDRSGRIELADWLVSDDDPLAARVMVNRVWAWVFGQGLVRTVDNFGTTGEMPANPELLDYLARRFQEEGWDLRALVRQMVLSRTWQLAVDREDSDPDNLWMSHASQRRLDAEQIRDAILSISGNLELAAGGPNIQRSRSSAPEGGDASSVEFGYKFGDNKRSLYTPAFRNNRLEIFTAFDFADVNTSQGQRHTSTVAPQALYFMNHPFVIEQSRLAGERALESSDHDDQRLMDAFVLCLGRLPSEAEKSTCEKLLQSVVAGELKQEEAWSIIYQSLFGSVDFRYIY